MAAEQKWTREEVLAAFALSFAIPRARQKRSHRLIAELAKAIDRTPDSVAQLLSEIESSSPKSTKPSRKHVDSQVRLIWNEYSMLGEELLNEALTLVENLIGERPAIDRTSVVLMGEHSTSIAAKPGSAAAKKPKGQSHAATESDSLLDIPFSMLEMDYSLKSKLIRAGFSTLREVRATPYDQLVTLIGRKYAEQLSKMRFAYADPSLAASKRLGPFSEGYLSALAKAPSSDSP